MAILAVIFVYNLLGYGAPDIRAGDRCGPDHHWVYQQANAVQDELICKAD